MSISYFGKVAITGIDGTMNYSGYGSATIATTSNIPQSIGFTDDMDAVPLANKSNEVVGMALRNKRKTVSVEFTPVNTDGTATLVNARLMQNLPTAGSQVTLAGFPGTPGDDGSLNDTYNYFGGGTMSFTQEGHVRMTMQIVKYSAGTFSAVAS